MALALDLSNEKKLLSQNYSVNQKGLKHAATIMETLGDRRVDLEPTGLTQLKRVL
ncbi:MAG: hypothetical protein OHK0035_11680 [Cyanobacteria bacterium J069]